MITKKNDELISIIVPVYNVEKYLDRCIKCLISQSYRNIEIILVNDGSTDNSKKICKKYKKIDHRIKLINKENGGLSEARNYGIKESKGNYLFFIDSDDCMHTDTISFLYKQLKNNDADIATILYRKIYEDDNVTDEIISAPTSFVYDNTEALEKLLYQENCTTSAWGKLYKKDLFRNVEYPVGKVHEDFPVTYKLFYKSTKVVISDAKMYYYLLRKTSITGSNYNAKRAISLQFAKEETEFVQKKVPSLISAANNREFMEGIFTILSIGNSKDFNDVKKQAKAIVKKYRFCVIKDPKAGKKSKIFAMTSFLGTNVMIFFCNLYQVIKRNV